MSSNSFASILRFPSARRVRISSGVPSPSQDQPAAMQHLLVSRSTTGTLITCLSTPEESCLRSLLRDPKTKKYIELAESQKEKNIKNNKTNLPHLPGQLQFPKHRATSQTILDCYQ